MKRFLLSIGMGWTALLLTGCTPDATDVADTGQDKAPVNKETFAATIRYTDHGVPHIEADDYPSLGYGIGYAQADENLCTLAEQMMKLQSRQSEFFGVGDDNEFLLSDIGYRALDLVAEGERVLNKKSAPARELLAGYAAGFNRRLSEFEQADGYPAPCRDADWVEPVTPKLLAAWHLELAIIASGRNFLPAIAAAAPPDHDQAAQLHAGLGADALLTSEGIGSNGWALGQERVIDANAMLLANPHFPLDGELRFFEQHLTIADEIDVSGITVIGMPAVIMGFNDQVGWMHTVSQAKRFTLYQLELDPDDPLRYRYDDQWREIESRDITLQVRQDDGRLETITHTVYASHYGPMLDLSSLEPGFAWTRDSALSLRDVNAGNHRMLDQWLAMARSTSTEDILDSFVEHQGLPFINTLLIDHEGNATYADASLTPHLSGTAEAWWREMIATPRGQAIWRDGAGMILLPGNASDFEWLASDNVRQPGSTPFDQAPWITRKDYVYNANSSHWLSHLQERLEGHSIVYGPEGTVRSPRTRYNAQLASEPERFGLTGEDRRFNLDALKRVLTHNGGLFGEEFRQQLADRCHAVSPVELDYETIDLEKACKALAAWDGRYHLASRGAHIMREFLHEFRVPGHRDIDDALFAIPFDPDTPERTPRDLAPAPDHGDDPVAFALARVVQRLESTEIAADAELGKLQLLAKSDRPEHRIPVSGGYSYEGVFNMMERRLPSRSTSRLANTRTGNPLPDSPLARLDDQHLYTVNYGSSFMLALAFTDNGPVARVMMSMSQSHDPTSPHFADQSRHYSRLQWRDMPITAQQIEAATRRVVVLEDS